MGIYIIYVDKNESLNSVLTYCFMFSCEIRELIWTLALISLSISQKLASPGPLCEPPWCNVARGARGIVHVHSSSKSGGPLSTHYTHYTLGLHTGYNGHVGEKRETGQHQILREMGQGKS